MEMTAREIIDYFGGLAEMSRKTGVPVSTIQHWYETDSIPHWRKSFIENKLKETPANDNNNPDDAA